jgi:WD40 repeat protein
MGNTANTKPNKRLGVPIVGKIESLSNKSTPENAPVLGCYILFPDNTIQSDYAKLFHILVVTIQGIEMYCLLTGEKRYPSYYPSNKVTIIASILSQNYIQNTHLIIAESNGGFAIIEAYSLVVTRRIGLSHSLPTLNATKNFIFSMISPAPEVLYVGYVSGVVKVWHTSVTSPQYTFGKEYESPAVRCLCYSSKHRLLVVGYEATFENQHGRFIKLEKNALKLFTPNASEEDTKYSLLEGFSGSCFSIGFVEKNDLAVALSSEDSGLYIWNILSRNLEIVINVPKLENYSQITTEMLILEMPNTNYIILGMSDGAVLVSELEAKNNLITWKPIKKISFQLNRTGSIEYLSYVEKIDSLVIGNTSATVTLISDFFQDGLGIEFSVVNEQKIDEI